MRELTINSFKKDILKLTIFIFHIFVLNKKKKDTEDNVNFSMSKFEVIKYVKSIIEEIDKQTHKIKKVKKDKDFLKDFLLG
jgi:hypothetical protein